MELEEIRKEVKEVLSEKRYQHSLGVEKRARILAKLHGLDEKRASLAGILHDVAKEMTKEEMLEFAQNHQIFLDPVEKAIPKVLHGKIAASLCKEKYGIDEQLQKAICYHTTGAKDMDDFAKIVYLADLTEENRNFEGVEEIRALSEKDLDEAMLWALDREITAKIKEKKPIHPASFEARNALLLQ